CLGVAPAPTPPESALWHPTSCPAPHRRESPTHPRSRYPPCPAWLGGQSPGRFLAASGQSPRGHADRRAAAASAASIPPAPATLPPTPDSASRRNAAR